MKLSNIFLTLLMVLAGIATAFASRAKASDGLSLSCDGSMEMRSSSECMGAMKMALDSAGCEASGLECHSSDYYPDGYDCSASSDLCVSPDVDDNGDFSCPHGYKSKVGSGESIIWNLAVDTLGGKWSKVHWSEVKKLADSRHTAEEWAAKSFVVCRKE